MTRDDLIAAQLHEFPDSRIVTDDEAAWWPMETTDVIVPRTGDKTYLYLCSMFNFNNRRTRQYEWLRHCVLYPVHVFYECGWNEDEEKYRWRGCRYGVNPEDYIGGYPR